ncbi:hypothetical protein AKJ09_05936 [Labilithrix luteola]|uniref:Phosphate-selective porin O and P n=1 Tax=Labilithrix luteola TaxID=1391654 RepID=A0A0K1Q0L5_9BACT|nr:porin [Labilithrix luteola]AKU99272.1 hypothetical protein AKJ09_05936 [Labilithrix luteola]
MASPLTFVRTPLGRIAIGFLALAPLTVASTSHAARDGEGPEDIGAKKTAPPPAAPPPAAAAATDTAQTTPTSVSPDTAQPAPPGAEPAPSAWDLAIYGYLRMAYDFTQKDDRYDFIGKNNGFVLDSARVGVQAKNREYNATFRVSIEGASDVLTSPNTPLGSLSVRLRDAFARWDPQPWIGIQAGQFKAPFQEEELRGTPDLMFASRAVGVDGVLTGRGFALSGIQLDRQLGVMISPSAPIGSPEFGIAYYLMVMNGNGSNQLLDDNGHLGLVGRVEANWSRYVRVGAAGFRNDRTVGTPPNLYNEEDLGVTGDVDVHAGGLEVFGAVTHLATDYPTVGASQRVQLAFHAQAAYRFDLPGFFLAPAYRFAYFDPWSKGGGEGFDTYKLTYHTVGIRAGHAKLPVQAWLNYTFTGEEADRKLTNDRLEILGQVTF